MPRKRIKDLREKVQEKTTEKEKTASKRRVKKKAKRNRRRRKAKKLKKKVTAPVKETAGLAGDVKDLTKAQAEALSARIPGGTSKGSPVSRRQKKRRQQAKGKSSSTTTQDDEMTDREEKILFAQQLRNQGLTTAQIANQVGMSASWVSRNTQAVPASRTPEASDDLEQSSSGFLGAIQDVEAGLFGGDLDGDGDMEGGIDIDFGEIERDLDLGGDIDDQFGDID